MLMPRKVKHRKQQRGRRRGFAKGGTVVTFGDFGIQALEPAWLTARQIEAARIAMTRHVKRGGKVWIRVFPDKPVTQKPAETRMGSGKGNPEHWVAVVKPGRVLFELAGVDRALAKEAMELAIQKLPFKARFVVRPGTHGAPELDVDPIKATEVNETVRKEKAQKDADQKETAQKVAAQKETAE